MIYRYEYTPELITFIESLGIILRPSCIESVKHSRKLEVFDNTLWEKHSIWTRDFRPVSLLMHSYCRSPLAGKITVGRYSSIGRSVKVMGFQHPYDRITTSPITYERRDSEAWKHLGYHNESVTPSRKQATVHIGHDCWIGEGVLIKPGLTIGIGSIIGANSVVTKNVEPFEIVAGNPARVVKRRFSEQIIATLTTARWWEFDLAKIPNIDFSQSPDKIVDELMESEMKYERIKFNEIPLHEVINNQGFKSIS